MNTGYSTVANESENVRGKPPLDPNALRTPEETEKENRIRRRQKRACDGIGGEPAKAGAADASTVTRQGALDQIRRLFPMGEGNQPAQAQLEHELLQRSTVDDQPFLHPVLLARVLGGLVDGDPARALPLLRELGNPRARNDAFAAQLALARCLGPGIEYLRESMQVAPLPDAHANAVRNEAFRQRYLAAGALCDALPSALRPRSMGQCTRLADAVSRLRDIPPDQRPPVSEAEAILLDKPLLVEAFRCASVLTENPAGATTPEMRIAYLAFRNDLRTEEELAECAGRLHKLNTYIDRATEHGAKRFFHGVQRAFTGTHKDPLQALVTKGTAGAKTRHPADDLPLRTRAMDDAVRRLNEQLGALPPQQWQSDGAIRKSIVTAAIRHWKSGIVNKGWSDEMSVNKKMRGDIVRDVATQLGVDESAVRSHPALKDLKWLNVETLDRWVRDEGLNIDGAAMADFRKLKKHGDTLIRHPTREQVRQQLYEVLQESRQTYNVRYGNQTAQGINASITDAVGTVATATGAPSVAAAPLARGARVRGADVHGGSNVHGGELLVGSTSGGSGGVGVSGFLGWNLFGLIKAGLGATATPLQVDDANTDAVVVRTRMDTVGSTDTNAWRTKLLDVYDVVTQRHPDGGATSPQEMWTALADRYFCDPNLSINYQRTHSTSASGSFTLTAGARAALTEGGPEVGPSVTVPVAKTYFNRVRRRDNPGHSGGNRTVELATNSANHGAGLTAALAAFAPPITGPFAHNKGHFGDTQGLQFPPATMGWSVRLWPNAAGATVRMVTDQGRVQPNYTVRDTETGSAERFAKYIDSQRSKWVAALGGDAAAERQLDEFLTEIVRDERRGNMTYGERLWMTPEAARSIDAFRAQIVAIEHCGRPLGKADVAEIKRLQGEVSRVLNDEGSWDPRSVWALGLNQESSTGGLNLILTANSVASVNAPRQQAVIIAPAGGRNRDVTHARF